MKGSQSIGWAAANAEPIAPVELILIVSIAPGSQNIVVNVPLAQIRPPARVGAEVIQVDIAHPQHIEP